MALNDLTGTTWKLLNTLYTYPVAGRTGFTFTITYETSELVLSTGGTYYYSFGKLGIGYLGGPETNGIIAHPVQTNSEVCYLAQGHDTKTLPDAWETFFTGTFTITGGNDATNADLITWLQANAEQIIIPDVAIEYNGEVISTLDYGRFVILETEGKYMADDVTVKTTTVKQGSAGTPVATKGAVSNHAVTVTPSVTNTTGYITGGTLSGTPATVQASELVSGTKSISISANGTTTEDVTDYASASITVAVPQPTGTKNISISANGTTTEDVTNYATASITVAVPQPSGSMTTVASGTYTGTGGYPSSAGTGFFVGTRMPKTDFWFKFCASSDSEFAYNTDYKHAYGLFVVFSEFGHYDLSTVGDSKQIISDITFDINNSGTVTATNAGIHIGVLNCVRNASATTTNIANNLRIDRRSNGFYVRPYNSNPVFKYVSGMTYNWELVYFGSNPSTDIVGVS